MTCLFGILCKLQLTESYLKALARKEKLTIQNGLERTENLNESEIMFSFFLFLLKPVEII